MINKFQPCYLLAAPAAFVSEAAVRGFAPKYARLTLAFLPSITGFGSLMASRADSLDAIVTLNIKVNV